MSAAASPSVAPPAAAGGLRFDLLAGLTAATVVVPKAMAVGLDTAFVPIVVYALLGTARVLSVSSTTTLAVPAGTALGRVATDGDPGDLATAAATLTVLTGLVPVAASLLRLGFVARRSASSATSSPW